MWEEIGAQKAIIVDLRLYYAQLANFTKEILIQNYVQGGDHDIFVCGCYVGRNGQLLGNFTDRKLRQDPPLVGTDSVVEAREVNEVLTPSVRLLKAFGYTGMAELEFKRDKSDGHFFSDRSESAALGSVRVRHYCRRKSKLDCLPGYGWIAPGKVTPVYV